MDGARHGCIASPHYLRARSLVALQYNFALRSTLSRQRVCDVRYIPPFGRIRDLAELSQRRGKTVVSFEYEQFIEILSAMIADIDVDEAWYLGRYLDVAEAISAGKLTSAKEHFIRNGYFEGRLPYKMVVDDTWYLSKNPDVAENVRIGAVGSAQAHFDEDGYREGRMPFDPLS